MLPTPDTSHVDTSLIYDPAEDSFLLLDALSSPSEVTFLQSRFGTPTHAPPLVVEVGTGSGVVLAFAAGQAPAIFGRPVLALGLDANPHACRAALATLAKAGAPHVLACAQADLLAALRPGAADVVLFNPPYVPTEPLAEPLKWAGTGAGAAFEQQSKLLELAYAGGTDGMEVTDRFLEQVPRVLARGGVVYLLLCQQNRPHDVAARIAAWEGGGVWKAEIVRRSGKQGGWEKLCILRIYRP